MNRNQEHNRPAHPGAGLGPDSSKPYRASSDLVTLPRAHLTQPTIADARLTSLKVLVLTLLSEIEALENQIDIDEISPLNLQQEVHRFEAELIRVALLKTGGRQRRAARLLGTKATTLNTKIKRYGIDVEQRAKS
jgi:DNA-binding NtrC family response regulator